MSMSSRKARSAPGVCATLRRALAGPVLGLILALALGPGAAQSDTSSQSLALHVAIADSGRAIFDGMVPSVTVASGLTAPLQVKYSTAVGALREFCRGPGAG